MIISCLHVHNYFLFKKIKINYLVDFYLVFSVPTKLTKFNLMRACTF